VAGLILIPRPTKISKLKMTYSKEVARNSSTHSYDLFQVMGVEPAVGCGFQPEEERIAVSSAVFVLGHDFC
jgi:hypothetical protein